MCEFKQMGFKIDNPEQSKALQNVLFKQGYSWLYGEGAQYLDGPWLHTNKGNYITWCEQNLDGYTVMDTQKYIDDFYKAEGKQMNNIVTMDKKYTYRDGSPARILCVDGPGEFPVVSMNEEGGIYTHHSSGVSEFTSYRNLVEVSPYAHIKIDDKVMVWNGAGCNHKHHFAGVNEEGFPTTWNGGVTSWSTTLKVKSSWDHCVKVED